MNNLPFVFIREILIEKWSKPDWIGEGPYPGSPKPYNSFEHYYLKNTGGFHRLNNLPACIIYYTDGTIYMRYVKYINGVKTNIKEITSRSHESHESKDRR